MAIPHMKHCMQCGETLQMKYHEQEKKMVPWCPSCQDWRFPVFNTAVSMIVMNRAKDRILLIKQYGRDSYILVAGYVNCGENAESAVKREVQEEMGLTVSSMHFNRSHYFEPTNTLMLNFTVTVEEDEPHPNWEIDSYAIFTRKGAAENIRRPSLAQKFLDAALEDMEKSEKNKEDADKKTGASPDEQAYRKPKEQKGKKLFIASDIHGSALYCQKMLDAFEREQADRILLLGDILYHGPRNDLPEGYAPKKVIAMLNAYKDRILCVRGNCDTEVDQMVLEFPILADYCIVETGSSRTIYAAHGHHYSPDNLPPFKEGDILLSGHTHIPMWEIRGENHPCLNPGSVSIPKKDSPHSYMILEDGVFTWKNLEGEAYHTQTLL